MLSDLFVRHESGRPPQLATRQSARLRRVDVESPGRDAGSLFAAMEIAGLGACLGPPDRAPDPGTVRRWATVVQLVALLAGTQGARAHDPGRSAGRAIRGADYSEARMMRLLASRGAGLRGGVVRLARFLAAKRVGALDLRPLAELVLHEGRDEARAERARLALARGFYGGVAVPKTDDDTNETDE